jgi:hypothetical protein
MGKVIVLSETYPDSLIQKMNLSNSEDAFLNLKRYAEDKLGKNSEQFLFGKYINEQLSGYFYPDFWFKTLTSLGDSYDLGNRLKNKDSFFKHLFTNADDSFSIDDKTKTEGTVLRARQTEPNSSIHSLLQGLFTHERISKERYYCLDYGAKQRFSCELTYGPKASFVDDINRRFEEDFIRSMIEKRS